MYQAEGEIISGLRNEITTFSYFGENPLLPLINKEVYDILNLRSDVFSEEIREKVCAPEIFGFLSAPFLNVLISLQYNKPQIIEKLFDGETEDVIRKIKEKMILLYGNEEDKIEKDFH